MPGSILSPTSDSLHHRLLDTTCHLTPGSLPCHIATGNGLLYNVHYQLLDKLQRVQNVAVRIVVRASRYDHITSILETLHWLPVRYCIEYKVVLMTFKALHLLAPSYIPDLLQFYQPCRTFRSSSDSLLTAHSAHLRHYGDLAFCIAAPRLWNSLPHEMQKCDSLYTFKRS